MSTDRSTLGTGGLVLLLSHDTDRSDSLSLALAAHGIALRPFAAVADLLAALERIGSASARDRAPMLVLADAQALSDTAELGTLAAGLRRGTVSGVALSCLVPSADLQCRLAALRAQATDCLERELAPAELAERLAERLGGGASEPDRVLVVDDQPVAALLAARVLEAAGMRTERVGSPLDVLAALERFQPHLILMDLHMPGVSGIELTAIIREQTRFAHLPILFLSCELDKELQLVAMRVGGDDFLAKPVVPQDLVQAVRDRLTRARRLAWGRTAARESDPQTGLASREHLLKTLDRQIQPAAPSGAGLIYLELPDDAAPARVGAGVAARLEPGDLAARTGEHGIAIFARRTDRCALAAFAQRLGQTGPGLGIGWCPLAMSGGEAVTLISRARKAARASQTEGRGRALGYGQSNAAPPTAAGDALPTAIEEDRLQLLFQPMVALRRGTAALYEATPRLHTPDGELLAPAAFAPQATRAGLTQRLDRWMLQAALDALRGCRDAGRSVGLFIHQSLESLADADWLRHIRDGIAERDLIRLRPIVQLQIAEADRDLALTGQRAEELERLGIRLCLNGLEEDARSAHVLATVPSDYVRLAADAVHTLTPERLAGLTARARAGGARVIATGADGPRTVERLYLAGVDLIQGPFVQPPGETLDFDFQASAALD